MQNTKTSKEPELIKKTKKTAMKTTETKKKKVTKATRDPIKKLNAKTVELEIGGEPIVSALIRTVSDERLREESEKVTMMEIMSSSVEEQAVGGTTKEATVRWWQQRAKTIR